MGLTGRVKLLTLVVLVVVATALTAGGILLVFAVVPAPSSPALLLAVGSLTVFVMGPLVLGVVAAYWDVRTSAEAAKHYLVYRRVVLGLEALAALAIVAFALLEQTSAILPLAFIAAGAVLTVLALVFGSKMNLGGDDRAAEPAGWRPVDRAQVVRSVWIAASTFAAVFALVAVLLASLAPAEFGLGERLVYALEAASIVTSVVCIVQSLTYSSRVRDLTRRDLGLTTKLAKAVLSAKRVELDDGERVLAVQYASLVSTLLGFQLAYFALLYTGITIQQVLLVGRDIEPEISIPILVLLVVALGLLFPQLIVRIRRARRYAREHGDLLPVTG